MFGSRIPRPVHTTGSLLIMRLITTIALSLLLVFGVASTSHTEVNGGNGPSAAAVGLALSGDDGAIGSTGQEQITSASVGTGTLTGPALCALGILCGLTAMVLFLRILHCPVRSPSLRACSRLPALLTPSGAQPHATAFSLTQLGLSRT